MRFDCWSYFKIIDDADVAGVASLDIELAVHVFLKEHIAVSYLLWSDVCDRWFLIKLILIDCFIGGKDYSHMIDNIS